MSNESIALEYIDGKSNKFWNATVSDCDVFVKFGRRGTAGQHQDKRFPSPALAYDAYSKKVNEKLMKGYVRSDGSSPPPPPPSDAAVAKLAKGLAKLEQELRGDDEPETWEPEHGPGSPDDRHMPKPVDAVASELEAMLPRRSSLPVVRPMLAEEVSKDELPRFAKDDAVVFQPKHDGHRVMLHIEGGTVKAYGRGGQRSQHEPRFLTPAYAALTRLPDCVLDGELVDDEFWCFDLPVFDSKLKIEMTTPYEQRLDALEALFDAADLSPCRLSRTARTEADKAQLALDCIHAGSEGVMVKTLAGKYSPGRRTKASLKAKFVKTADVIVTAIGAKGHDNYVLSVYRDGELAEIGACSAIGKAAVKVGQVIEVKYLYVGAQGRLYQPRMLHVRTDKTAEECLYSQFDHAHVNKEVIC